MSKMESSVVFLQVRRKSFDCLQTVVSKSRETKNVLNGAACKLNGSEDVNTSSLSPDDYYSGQTNILNKEEKLRRILMLNKSYEDL